MVLKYDAEVKESAISQDLNRLRNLIFKMLPVREENGEWKPLLNSLMLEIAGMDRLFCGQMNYLILLSKLEVLNTLDKEEDFMAFRKIVFESIGIVTRLEECL